MLIKSIKTLIVEDSKVLAERLQELVVAIPEIDLVAVVESEAAALTALRQSRIDVLILDLQLKEGSGLGVLKAIALAQRKPQVIVFTNHDVTMYQETSNQFGADYFLDKARDIQRLPLILDAIVSARYLE